MAPTTTFLNALPSRCWFKMKRIGTIHARVFLCFAPLWCFLCKLVSKLIDTIRRDCQSSPCIIPASSLSWYVNLNIGFAMLCAGAVRRKNVQNTMLKNLLDAVSFVVVEGTGGFAIFVSRPQLEFSSFLWLLTLVRSISCILRCWICIRIRKQW